MALILCISGTTLLIISVILCIFSDNEILWRSALFVGEILAILGCAPVFLELLGK